MRLAQRAREFLARRAAQAAQRAERRAARRAQRPLDGTRERAPTKADRPRCGARCRDGHACNAPVVVRREGHALHIGKRCRMHGGESTGPRTEQGRRRALDALARGRARVARGAGGRFVRASNPT